MDSETVQFSIIKKAQEYLAFGTLEAFASPSVVYVDIVIVVSNNNV